MKPLACFSLLIILTFASIGQTIAPSQKDKAIPVKVEYDRFKDTTTITLEGEILIGSDSDIKSLGLMFLADPSPYFQFDVLAIAARFRHQGESAVKPEEVTLGIFGISPKRRFQDDRELIFLVDGERIKLGSIEKFNEEQKGAAILESMRVKIPYATFRKIVFGKSVEGKVGSREFSFSNIQLESLRNLADRMQQ